MCYLQRTLTKTITLWRKQMIELQIKKTLSADGLSIQQINEYVTDTEEKQYTVFAFHKGQYVTMIVYMSDIEKYIDLVISGHSYFGARIPFMDCSLEATLIEAMNIVKQQTASN